MDRDTANVIAWFITAGLFLGAFALASLAYIELKHWRRRWP